MQFTFEQLAHFDRCLFPDDIAEDIGEVAGYEYIEVLLLKLEFRQKAKKGSLNVIGLYQDRIHDDRFCNALIKVVQAFCNKYIE